MKIKTSELTGPALDWAVAKCEGFNPYAFTERDVGQKRPLTRWCGINVGPSDHEVFAPSTDPAQAWPIIDREHIDIRFTFTEGGYRTSTSVDAVHATINLPNGATVFDPEKTVWEYGPTPLIAAMRCFIASKLGDEVEIPDELFQPTI